MKRVHYNKLISNTIRRRRRAAQQPPSAVPQSLGIIRSFLLMGIVFMSHRRGAAVEAQNRQTVKIHFAPRQILLKYRSAASVRAMESARRRVKAELIGRFSGITPKPQLQRLEPNMSVERGLARDANDFMLDIE